MHNDLVARVLPGGDSQKLAPPPFNEAAGSRPMFILRPHFYDVWMRAAGKLNYGPRAKAKPFAAAVGTDAKEPGRRVRDAGRTRRGGPPAEI